MPSLLVIEDDPAQQMTVLKVSAKAGYLTTSAATVEGAIEKLRQHTFDSIALDILLSGQNGMLLLNEIASTNPRALLIVASSTSAAVRQETLALAVHLGLDVVELPKPVDLAALRALLATRAEEARS